MAHWGEVRGGLLPLVETGQMWRDEREPLRGVIVRIVSLDGREVDESFVGRPYSEWQSMTPEEQALRDLMPVIDKIVGAIMHSARGDWDNVQREWLAATDLFMDITNKDHPVMVLYKEWLRCQKEQK